MVVETFCRKFILIRQSDYVTFKLINVISSNCSCFPIKLLISLNTDAEKLKS